MKTCYLIQIVKEYLRDQNYPRHSYQAQRTSLFTNKLDWFEDSFKPSNFLSNNQELTNMNVVVFKISVNPLFPRQSKETFSGDRVELLILKAKKNIEPSSEEPPKPMKKDSHCSLNKLDVERSWENIPVTFKSPVPFNSTDSFQTSRGNFANNLLKNFYMIIIRSYFWLWAQKSLLGQ